MTDRELIERFKRAPVKALEVLMIAREEGTDFKKTVERLQKLGYDAQTGLRRALHCSDLERVSQEKINWYLKKNKKRPEDMQPRPGCIDESCEDCRFLERNMGLKSCGYLTTTGHRRGCPAGTGCTKKEKRK